MPALTLTRRTALGSGLAAASVASFASRSRCQALPTADALFVDGSVQLPAVLAPFIEARRQMLPVVELRLDAAGHSDLHRILASSSAIAGITSGAALFCLERIAWDHGFRLAGRIERQTDEIARASSPRELSEFLGGLEALRPSDRSIASAYRPSRTDGKLHTWVLRAPAARFRIERRGAA